MLARLPAPKHFGDDGKTISVTATAEIFDFEAE
jgi:hypothetical protein